MKQPAYIVSIVLLWLIALVMGVMAYQLWWPITPATINKVDLLTPEVRAGEQLKYYVDVTKHVNAQAMVVRQLVNDTVITLTPVWSNVEPGRTRRIVSIIIPPGTHPGRYKMACSYTYDVNAFRTITVRFETDYFTVKQ